MTAAPRSRSPHWYGALVRALLITFVASLLVFAVTLLFSIFGVVITGALYHRHPDMSIAYRHIAIPVGIVAAVMIFVFALINEIRHYRQSKTLTAIERMN
jgi:TRAP-type C4-dicarboxylate transport system permease small subunit